MISEALKNQFELKLYFPNALPNLCSVQIYGLFLYYPIHLSFATYMQLLTTVEPGYNDIGLPDI